MTQTDKDLKKGRARGDLLLGGGIENDDITGVDFVDTAGQVSESSGLRSETLADSLRLSSAPGGFGIVAVNDCGSGRVRHVV